MPLEKIEITESRVWGLWKLEETESDLSNQLIPHNELSDTITNEKKRLETLSGRLLIKALLKSWQLAFDGITKDEFGKPFLVGYDFHLSLSHSYPYVAGIVDKYKPVGIDLEQPKPKLFKIAPRIFNPDEMLDVRDSLTKHCIYWCAKETLIKIYGKKDLFFIKNMRITPFVISNSGCITGQIIVNDIETNIPLQYIVAENFVLVISS